jgi:hypothetical protein
MRVRRAIQELAATHLNMEERNHAAGVMAAGSRSHDYGAQDMRDVPEQEQGRILTRIGGAFRRERKEEL